MHFTQPCFNQSTEPEPRLRAEIFFLSSGEMEWVKGGEGDGKRLTSVTALSESVQ